MRGVCVGWLSWIEGEDPLVWVSRGRLATANFPELLFLFPRTPEKRARSRTRACSPGPVRLAKLVSAYSTTVREQARAAASCSDCRNSPTPRLSCLLRCGEW